MDLHLLTAPFDHWSVWALESSRANKKVSHNRGYRRASVVPAQSIAVESHWTLHRNRHTLFTTGLYVDGSNRCQRLWRWHALSDNTITLRIFLKNNTEGVVCEILAPSTAILHAIQKVRHLGICSLWPFPLISSSSFEVAIGLQSQA